SSPRTNAALQKTFHLRPMSSAHAPYLFPSNSSRRIYESPILLENRRSQFDREAVYTRDTPAAHSVSLIHGTGLLRHHTHRKVCLPVPRTTAYARQPARESPAVGSVICGLLTRD